MATTDEAISLAEDFKQTISVAAALRDSESARAERDAANARFRTLVEKLYRECEDPMSSKLMDKALVTASGSTYHADSIQSHLERTNIDPSTNTPLQDTSLRRNRFAESVLAIVRDADREYADRTGEKLIEHTYNGIFDSASGF